jgi:hypothetical protein
VAQVDANAGPRREPPAHGVDEHVVRVDESGCGRVSLLPALEAGECVVLVLRLRDGDEWVNRLAPPAACLPALRP